MATVVADALQGAAGAVAGVASMAITYPLYTITMQAQAQKKVDQTPNKDRKVKTTKLGLVAIISKILKEEGIAGFFKGIRSALVANGLQSAVYYYFYAFFKNLHGVAGKHLPIMSILTAAEAGVTTVLVTNPFWEVNMRQVTSDANMEDETGLMKALTKIVNKEGVSGLYSGVVPALFLVSAPMSQFFFYDLTLRMLADGKDMSHLLTPFYNLVLGAWSKALSTIVTYPLQTARTRMIARRNDALVNGKRPYETMLSSIRHIVKTEGLDGLWSGISSKLFQTSLTAALLLLIRLQVLNQLRKGRQ